MRRGRRWAFAGAAVSAVVMATMSAAWACVSGPAVNLSTIQAKAGQEVGIKGASFRTTDDVVVRFNALDGALLTRIKPVAGNIEGSFTVPAGTKPGNYVIVATQDDANGKLSMAPVRAALTVVGETGAVPVVGESTPVDSRTPGLVTSDQSISRGTLWLIALGVGGVGMFIAGVAALVAGRRSHGPELAPVQSRR